MLAIKGTITVGTIVALVAYLGRLYGRYPRWSTCTST
jgi:hypothetical protein